MSIRRDQGEQREKNETTVDINRFITRQQLRTRQDRKAIGTLVVVVQGRVYRYVAQA